MKGFVVLTDRYPQSEFAGLCDGPKLNDKKGFISRKEKECFRVAKLCSPDLVVKMLVSPEKASERKPSEIDIITNKNLTERIKNIHFSPYTKSVLIDTDKSIEQVVLEVKRIVWEVL